MIELFSTIKVYILGGSGWNMYNNGSDFNDSDFKTVPFKIFLDGSDCRLYPGASHRKSIYYRKVYARRSLFTSSSSHRSHLTVQKSLTLSFFFKFGPLITDAKGETEIVLKESGETVR